MVGSVIVLSFQSSYGLLINTLNLYHALYSVYPVVRVKYPRDYIHVLHTAAPLGSIPEGPLECHARRPKAREVSAGLVYTAGLAVAAYGLGNAAPIAYFGLAAVVTGTISALFDPDGSHW